MWRLAIEHILEEKRLAPEEGEALFSAPLAELGAAADFVCRRMHPELFRTFVIDRNINFTDICISGCRFCAFFKSPDDPEGYVLNTEAILNKIEEAIRLGATQILMQGGLHPELPLTVV